MKKSSVRTREGVCAGARLREGVRKKSEREQRRRRKKGAVRGVSVSLFSSRPVLLLIPYLFCPSLFLFPLLVLECLSEVVCHWSTPDCPSANAFVRE